MSDTIHTPTLSPEQQELANHNSLVVDMASFQNDPLGWVHYSFKWGQGELEGFPGPDVWQTETLKYISDRLQAKAINTQEAISYVIQVAVASGNGPGKSALVAWIILWALSTFEDTRGVVTANTDTQLRTKTWPELSKWYRLFIAKHWFVLTATAIYAKAKEHERTWRIDQVPWSLENVEAFAGLHNKGKRIVLIFDEASAIPDKIWETAEGALTDKDTQILWLVFGNPTRNTGRFRECWGKFRNRWKQWQLDIRNSILVNQQQVAQWIEDLGIDNDWVRVHVLGLFPKASDLQFISSELITPARGRQVQARQYLFAPKIIGVDMAWSGGDEIVIGIRQGIVYRQLQVFEKNEDDSVIAAAVAKHEDTESADAVHIDLGYGTGVYSFGKQMNRKWTLVSFGGKSSKPGFANKRAEMWGDMKQWLKEGGCIPDDQRLADDLAGPEAYPNLKGEIVLESKKDMKKRGLASPSRADAPALTFALPVMKKKPADEEGTKKKKDYDPTADYDK
jgi:hypothetical protein